MAFEKGRSGNPGGRPAAALDDGRTLADVAREHTVAAIESLVRVKSSGYAIHICAEPGNADNGGEVNWVLRVQNSCYDWPRSGCSRKN